ncbi:hypothetical protein [Nocardia aurea]|uniref:Uncharacterized protein n=1 Tax=Nocardia aurea TaxID=2144174 RepID=A0ABV3FR79_9NOCA
MTVKTTHRARPGRARHSATSRPRVVSILVGLGAAVVHFIGPVVIAGLGVSLAVIRPLGLLG